MDRVCTRCGMSKPLSGYYRDVNYADGCNHLARLGERLPLECVNI